MWQVNYMGSLAGEIENVSGSICCGDTSGAAQLLGTWLR